MTIQLPSRTFFEASKGRTYSYVHIRPAGTATHPTLLLLHGFPSHVPDWTRQIDHFARLGYGIIACDLLGFGQSSKPADASSYRLKPMADQLHRLLDAAGVQRVVGIGHDIGSTLLSRFAAYHPDRFMGLVFLAVGPPKLGTRFDLDSVNAATRRAMGFELLGYINWLSDGDDQGQQAQPVLERNAASAMSLLFARDPRAWDEWLRPLNKMQQFVTEDRRVPLGEWYTSDLQRRHLEAFGREGGHTGSTRWYRMWRDNLFAPDEEGFEELLLSQPALLVAPTGAGQQEQMLAAWAPRLTVRHVDSGHWLHLEKAAETNAAVQEFLDTLGSGA
ncbi:Epoxide hydrolase-like protein [Metarhizium album ARSEF 1941]|uniref:Epoxide hydrolase-like protein n=1 Tax=Metarhizium album (strain ARSEF 1941) TaxID=1081103 RepID=A0A0B2WLS9_METAS|nr:Epoxide hydrolase-like protein [Metarhizium album ARSEF 1941]KHN94442.1 Epoxide hydrolase-like protein [Metarhizium album ARSEF 1941]